MMAIRRVAVLGAGTMGSRIAAHFANAGVPALLLDLAAPREACRSALARRGLENALHGRPPAFFTEAAARLVTPGNFDDHLDQIAAADWVIEAVAENLEIKRSLWRRVEWRASPGSILSTNTSGIPLARIVEGFSPEFRRRFLGTHFFNPPRYLRLLELIPGPDTDPELAESVARFAAFRLGKGVVCCRDTPNFIANRLGSFFAATVYRIVMEDGYTIEEADLLTGPLIGLPSTATFRLADLIGLDVWTQVARNLYDSGPDDVWRSRFAPPPFVCEMLERGWLGAKAGQGFYRRSGGGQEVLNWRTLEYGPAVRPRFEPGEEQAMAEAGLDARLRRLLASPGRAGTFLWKLFRDLFRYAAGLVPEVSPRIVEIDRAMRWGYAWKLGPFELWDAVGLRNTAARMRAEAADLPPAIERMLELGAGFFYRPADSRGQPRTEYFDLAGGRFHAIEERPGVLSLAGIKRARGVITKTDGAALVDLGEGVLCLELQPHLNALAEESSAVILAAIEEAGRAFEAMVIAGDADAFHPGAHLAFVVAAARAGEWDKLGRALARWQEANLAIKYSPRPVVAAPCGKTLGPGCELVLHAARVQAGAELSIGLAEVEAGLVPSGGGPKELLARGMDPIEAFRLMAGARVSSSAQDARRLGWIRGHDPVSMNPDHLLGDARRLALALAPGFVPPLPGAEIQVPGAAGYAAMRFEAWSERQAGRLSEHGLAVAERLARVLSGGGHPGRYAVSERYLLELEREAFLSLCGNARTQASIEHLLKTGKPLRE